MENVCLGFNKAYVSSTHLYGVSIMPGTVVEGQRHMSNLLMERCRQQDANIGISDRDKGCGDKVMQSHVVAVWAKASCLGE